MKTAKLIESQVKAMAIYDANDECMNVTECAKYLKRNRNTIYKWIDDGKIKVVPGIIPVSIPKIQFLKKIIEDFLNTEDE